LCIQRAAGTGDSHDEFHSEMIHAKRYGTRG
jgi:hypothetical protein